MIIMKRVISILMAFVIAISSVITGFAVYTDEKSESKMINGFITGIADLARKYDSEKEFVTIEGGETAQIQFFRVEIQKKLQIILSRNILYRTFKQPD